MLRDCAHRLESREIVKCTYYIQFFREFDDNILWTCFIENSFIRHFTRFLGISGFHHISRKISWNWKFPLCTFSISNLNGFFNKTGHGWIVKKSREILISNFNGFLSFIHTFTENFEKVKTIVPYPQNFNSFFSWFQGPKTT